MISYVQFTDYIIPKPVTERRKERVILCPTPSFAAKIWLKTDDSGTLPTTPINLNLVTIHHSPKEVNPPKRLNLYFIFNFNPIDFLN